MSANVSKSYQGGGQASPTASSPSQQLPPSPTTPQGSQYTNYAQQSTLSPHHAHHPHHHHHHQMQPQPQVQYQHQTMAYNQQATTANMNFLNTASCGMPVNAAGGSLPDLTSFQYNQNGSAGGAMMPPHLQHPHQQAHYQHQMHQHPHHMALQPQQQHNYDLQLLQVGRDRE